MPILVLLFIVLPLAELYVLIQIGQAIGALPAIAILLLDGIVGAWLARSQGRTAWRRFNEAMAAGRVPGKEVFDGAMVILGGALLLTPGFITDVFGILLLLPPTRALLRRLVIKLGIRIVPAAPAYVWVGSRGPDPSRPRPPGDIDGTAHEVGDDSRLPARSEHRDA